jgi:ATP-binding cassette subfamily B multidrug efflux pump
MSPAASDLSESDSHQENLAFTSESSRGSILWLLLKRYRRELWIGVAAIAFVDFLEIIPPLILKAVIDEAVAGASHTRLNQLVIWLLVVTVGQGICRYLWRMYVVRTSFFAGRDLRMAFSKHLLNLSQVFFSKRPVGELMSLANSDVDAVRNAVGSGVVIVVDAFFYLITIPAAMYWVSPKLATVTLIPLLIIPFAVMKFEKQIHDRSVKLQDSWASISAHLQESLSGMRVIKSFRREESRLEQLESLGKTHVDLGLSLARVQSVFGPSMDLIVSLVLVGLLAWGGQWVIQETITLGTLIAFQRFIQKLVWPMTAIALGLSHYQRAVASSGRLKEVFRETPIWPNRDELSETEPHRVRRLNSERGRVEWRKVQFHYSPQSPILRDFQLTIESGERVAITGPVGSGKTTALALLSRLYIAQEGQVLIDGIDVRDWPKDELRSQMGIVPQDVFLFGDSIWKNISLADRLAHQRSEEEQRHRAKLFSQIAEFDREALATPNAYDTLLGERGLNLSGGQRQRLSLARALAAEPSILVLDDALSAVDVRTESAILEQLKMRPGRNTEIYVAHRISTLSAADRIVVLERGQVVDEGTHTQLLRKRSGPYWRLYEQQRLREELESIEQSKTLSSPARDS